jgi:serine/threonine protein kinase/tetratricopeptide (TPR) repeat protein
MTGKSEERSERRRLVPLNAGAMIDRYRVVKLVGSGGMGEVYQAEDPELQRTVAIKLLPPATRTPEAREQFQNEARAAAALSHPNLVTVYDFGEHQGRPFFAMEYVDGESLLERLARGPLAIEDAVNITLQVCRGLAAVHRTAMMHRDLKPSNVMIDRTGRVKILDFGLAAVKEGLTAPDDPRSGTLSYMSPEQLSEAEVTPRSDLWSLGVVLYEMLTGRRPFEGDYEASLIYSIVNDPPKSLCALRPEVPEDVQNVVKRLLEKDPSVRYQQADDVIADLGGKRPRESDSARGEQPRRGLVVGAAILALLVIVFVWLKPWTDHDAERLSRKTLAVLPMENLGAPDDQYFADGVMDAITTDLARMGGIAVISRASVIEYRDSRKDVRQIGSELGCQLLVTGTVYWDKSSSPNRVRVHASLIDAPNDTHLWADSYEGVLSDIFDLQSRIARDVATELQLVLHEGQQQAPTERPTSNLEAYDFYLRGNEYFNRSWEEPDIEIAAEMYGRAVALDPEFAVAWAMLSRAHASMYWEYYDHTDQRKEQARLAAERALVLAPDLTEGHLAMGYYYYHCEGEYVEALKAFQLALSRCPNNAELYNAIAAVQRRIGPMEQAAVNFMRAAELDPRSHLKLFDVGLTFSLMRRYDQAEVYLDKVIALAPDWPLVHVYKAWIEIFRDGNVTRAREILAEGAKHADMARSHYYWWLERVVEPDHDATLRSMKIGSDTAMYYLHRAQLNRLLGRYTIERQYADSARVMLEGRVKKYPDNARFHSYLGRAYAGLRMREPAFAHAQRAMELLPTSRDAFDALFFTLDLVETCVVFEEYDRAIAQLQFLLSIPGFVSPSYLKLDPLWEPLHNHPRWPDLVGDTVTTR